jgi:hypothetical protein
MVDRKNDDIMETKKLVLMIVFGLMFIAFASPFVSAYRLNIPMPNLWDALVEYGFGGFWLTVFIMMLIFTLIMAVVGGVSWWSTTLFNLMFFMSMTIGYGARAWGGLVFIALMIWSFMEVIMWLNNSQR